MSKARLVLTALFVDHQRPAEVATRYGVSRAWVYKLKARYEAEGEAAFEPRSRRPKTNPTALPRATVDLIIELREKLSAAGLDAGPDTIAWHLAQHHQVTVSLATISRYLTRAGLVVPEPKKRPKASYIRFQAAMPNETWQSDFTHYRLTPATGQPGRDVEIISWLDDCSRYALHISAHPRITGPIVLATFRNTLTAHGIPASTLTDNGMVYTTRFAGGRGGRNSLEAELRGLHIAQKNSRPNHPTTCGKVERFQQTMKKWLRGQPAQPATIAELQRLLDQFSDEYNHRRPHRSLPQRATPATIYNSLPKALPGPSRDTDTHDRIRHDRIDDSGCVTLRVNGTLHHIGIGRTQARTHVILLVQDLHVRIVNAVTGELLRELTIDPTKNYQATGAPKGPTRK
ncbi:IS481 family transposase [Nocardioides mesophilus]|uniref:IS481 family transposase n=1 Tax=Nocardioides mesophilus TaxID=433659 RepID=A0A7G9RGJ7_9ACTN|nr:IS481 family transposase [Nocardioides mesophilus]QNN52657.1 IS481 family transposase [Nocardioides mesophilus]QNN54105.1 IS481 family transposase [Nocardioides mesophilus]QNN54722.1 IS481 family transposase [Nocardioides mesophilus]